MPISRLDHSATPVRTHTPQGIGPWPAATDLEPLRAVPWLSSLLSEVPPTAGVPRWMTAPHPEAVGSYGAEAAEWSRREMGIELRWFQKLSMARQLEHRADGSLCWRYVVESTPRRVGKSIRLKVMCCWRVDHAELLGEPQTVLFTGKDLPICKEIHRSAWAWAAKRGWRVGRGMGNEELEKLSDESRWLVRSQNGVYGYPAGLAACDESWAVPDAVIREGLQPAMMERANPQMLLTSTAHTKATPLMRRRILDALGGLDGSGDTLLLLWSAHPDADPADPESWRAASPHWDGERARLVADAWRHVESGQAIPDPLEPDPVAGFTAQYLNIWPALNAPAESVWIAASDVAEAIGDPGDVTCGVGALESSRDGRVWAAAIAVGTRARVQRFESLTEALAWLQGMRASVVLCHQAVAAQLTGVEVEVVTVTRAHAVAATKVLHDYVAAHEVVVTGAPLQQFANVVVSLGEEGPRIDATRSRGDVDAVKCLSWALWFAYTRAPELARIF